MPSVALPNRRGFLTAATSVAIAAWVARRAGAAATVPAVAAAADLNYALKDVAERFTKGPIS